MAGLSFSVETKLTCFNQDCKHHGTGGHGESEVTTDGTARLGIDGGEKIVQALEIIGCAAHKDKVFPLVDVPDRSCDRYGKKA